MYHFVVITATDVNHKTSCAATHCNTLQQTATQPILYMTLLTSLHLTENKCLYLECDSRTVSITPPRKLTAQLPRQ